MPKNEKCPRCPQLNVKADNALRLRTLGLTYREIAIQLQVPVSTAYGRVMRGLRDLRHRQHEAPNDVRHIELLKLAHLERRVMAEAVSGDHAAIRLLLRIMDSRKRYLATCLPSTSSKEELDELLQVFTQPMEGMPMQGGTMREIDDALSDGPLQGDMLPEDDWNPDLEGGFRNDVQESDGQEDAMAPEPFPAVADLAVADLAVADLAVADLAAAMP